MAVQKVKVGRENWVKDGDVTNCSMCMATFGCVTRKHHCRACGNVFCSSCSNNDISYTPSTRKNEEGYQEKKKRVCKACYKSLDDTQRRLEKAKQAAGGGSRVDLSFTNPNMVLTGSSFMGSSLIANSFVRPAMESLRGNSLHPDASKKAAQLTIEESPRGPALVLPTFSLNPFSWGAPSRRREEAERKSSFGLMDAGAAFMIRQQEQKRHNSVAEPEQELSPERAPGAEASELDMQLGSADMKCLDFDLCSGDGEKEAAVTEALFSYYLEKLQEQKTALESKLYAQGENEGGFAETPSQAEVEAVDKQFDMVMRESNLYDEASPSFDFGRMLCGEAKSQDACAQPEAETPEQSVQDLGASETNASKLLKLSLTVLKLSLQFEYRRKMISDTCASETCSSTECPSQAAQEVS